MTPSTPRPTRRATGTVAVAVVAAGLTTTVVTALLGAGPSPAAADPGDTYVPSGSSQLVQSEDLQSIQMKFDTQTVRLNLDEDFSSCLGEGNSWTEVLPGSPKPVSGVWTRRGHTDHSLVQDLAQAKTEAQAKRWEKILIKSTIVLCRTPRYDFHYGPMHSSNVGAGHASWAVSYTADEKRPDGGVAVVRLGKSVGLVQVNGTWGPAGQMMESVAKVATDRLG